MFQQMGGVTLKVFPSVRDELSQIGSPLGGDLIYFEKTCTAVPLDPDNP